MQNRSLLRIPVLSYSLFEFLFPIFSPVILSCLKNRPEKSLSRGTRLDFELKTEKPVPEPVFRRQVADPSIKQGSTRRLNSCSSRKLKS